MITISIMKNNTQAIPIQIQNIFELCDLIKNNDWSPSTFENNYRKKYNFIQTNLIVLDVDDGLSIEQAKGVFQSYQHIIATTRNHQKEKNGKVADRYRVILFLSESIKENSNYDATWQSVYKKFPFIDRACKDSSRFFYKCEEIYSSADYGILIDVITAPPKQYNNEISNLRGYYPPSYLYAKKFGLQEGGRNNAVYRIACELYRCGYDEDEVFNLMDAVTDLPSGEIQRTIMSAARAVIK